MFLDPPDVRSIRQPARVDAPRNLPLNPVGAAFLFLVAAGVILELWTLNYLKVHQRAIWQELECPTFWGGSRYKVFRFMVSKRRKAIGDVHLNRLAMAMLTLSFFTLVTLIGLVSGVLVT